MNTSLDPASLHALSTLLTNHPSSSQSSKSAADEADWGSTSNHVASQAAHVRPCQECMHSGLSETKDLCTDKTTTKKEKFPESKPKKKSKDIWHVAEASIEDGANTEANEDADPKVRPLQYYAAGMDDDPSINASSSKKPAPEYVSSYR